MPSLDPTQVSLYKEVEQWANKTKIHMIWTMVVLFRTACDDQFLNTKSFLIYDFSIPGAKGARMIFECLKDELHKAHVRIRSGKQHCKS